MKYEEGFFSLTTWWRKGGGGGINFLHINSLKIVSQNYAYIESINFSVIEIFNLQTEILKFYIASVKK